MSYIRAKQADGTIVKVPLGGSAKGAVLYTPQTLTAAQQEQARANLGIVGEEQYEFADSVEDIPADAADGKYTPEDFMSSQCYRVEVYDDRIVLSGLELGTSGVPAAEVLGTLMISTE